MNDIINGQISSIDYKLPKVIRESAEFKRSDKEDFLGSVVSCNKDGNDDYETLKS